MDTWVTLCIFPNFHVCITNWGMFTLICSTCDVCPSKRESNMLTHQLVCRDATQSVSRVTVWLGEPSMPHFHLKAQSVPTTGTTGSENECDQPPPTAQTGEPRETIAHLRFHTLFTVCPSKTPACRSQVWWGINPPPASRQQKAVKKKKQDALNHIRNNSVASGRRLFFSNHSRSTPCGRGQSRHPVPSDACCE